MYLATGLGQGWRIKRRPKKVPAPAKITYVTVTWRLEVPFRKDFRAFRQELSKTIRELVTAETDKTLIDSFLLEDKYKYMVAALKEVHGQLLKQKSPKLKDSDPVKIDANIRFDKTDYTDVWSITVTQGY
jgi:hypothetical protein